MTLLKLFANRAVRPYLLVLLAVGVIVLFGGVRVLTGSTAYSVLQQFATLGPVALALGLTMIVRHFDISVAGMVGFAGCVAVLWGVENPFVGLLAAVTAGAFVGLLQGTIIVRLRLSAIGVTLGGLLTLVGLAHVVTGNEELGYARLDVGAIIDEPVMGPMSPRFLVALALFSITAFLISFTRIGRDLLATGSAPKAAMVAGVRTQPIVIGAFVASGAFSALSGALLSYSLATASPAALSNTLVPATAAAIIGGVSLSGGRGHPLGIAGGVLVLCVLQSGLTAVGVAPFVHDIAAGAVLLAVGLLDGAEVKRRIDDLKRASGLPPFSRPA